MHGIEHLLATAGLPLVAVMAFVEGDSLAMIAGALAHRGFWTLTGAILAAAFGAFLSDQMWFWAGRLLTGSARVRRLLDRPMADRVRRSLGDRPLLPLFVFRFLWGTRIVAPLVFGAAGVGPLRFLLVDLVGVTCWAVLFAGVGYGLGAGIERLIGRLDLPHHVGLLVLGIVAVLGLVWLVHRWIVARTARGQGPNLP